MEDYKEYFPKSKKVYFDHATKSLPPSVSLINLKPSRNYNHSFSEIARSNQKLYLSIKRLSCNSSFPLPTIINRVFLNLLI